MTRSLRSEERFEDVYEKSGSRLTENERSSLIRTILQDLDQRIEQLQSKDRVLPKVEKDGGSECPFAEDLYRAKMEAEAALTEKVNVVRQWIHDEESELKRCEGNLGRIEGDQKKLNKLVAKKAYDASLGLQEREYVNTKSHLKDLRQGLAKATQLLEQTKPHAFPVPLGEEMDVGKPPNQPANLQHAPSSDSNRSAMIEELVEMGPLGKTEELS